MAKVIGIDKATDPSMTVYDPACGSGSLLIRAADEAPCEISIYGQEKDNSTAGLARMNLVLHNKGAGVIVGNKSTLSAPQYKAENNPELLKTFNYIVVNPPFSDKSWMDGITVPDSYGRYSEAVLGLPPEKNGDYAWLLHVLKSLKSTARQQSFCPMVCCSVAMPRLTSAKRSLTGVISKALLVCLLTCSMAQEFLPVSWCWTKRMLLIVPAFS